MTLTRDEIINRRDGALLQAARAQSHEDRRYDLVTAAICDLALIGLDVQPRPIEATPNYVDVLVFYDDGSIDFKEADDNDYQWKPYAGAAGHGIVRPTHSILISALPKPEEKKP